MYTKLVGNSPYAGPAAPGFDTLVDRVSVALGSADEATEVAVSMWSALHGFATLRATGTPKAFPPPAAFVARLLDAHF